MTTLEELQVDTDQGADQNRGYMHHRGGSGFEMRDMMDLAQGNSTFMENNPIFDFNYLQGDNDDDENDNDSNKGNEKELNMNRYMEFLESQKTKLITSGGSNPSGRPPLS